MNTPRRAEIKSFSALPLFGGVAAEEDVSHAVEHIALDVRKKALVRRITLTNGGHVFSEVCPAPSDPRQDLHSAADLGYLQRQTRPVAVGSRGSLRVADLFSGCGGMSLGVEEACRALGLGFDPVAAFDIWEDATAAYSRNFPSSTIVREDLADLLERDLKAPQSSAERRLKRQLQPIDLVLAGPPCQGHSNLNNHTRRNDPKNELYFRVARFAKLFKPNNVVIENVVTVRNDKGNVVGRTSAALQSLGYEVSEGIVDLHRIGVPQTRRRHILVASHRSCLKLTGKRLPSIAQIVNRHQRSSRNAMWAIRDLMPLAEKDAWNSPAVPAEITSRRIQYLFENDCYELPRELRPKCHRLNENQFRSYYSVYGRMYPHKPAPTITGGFDTMGRGRFVHPLVPRTITPHEAARLQGFPDFFDFGSVTKRSVLCDMIGNAVPPRLSYTVAIELLR